MKKTIMLSLACVFALFLIIGCSGGSAPVEDQNAEEPADQQNTAEQEAATDETEQGVEEVAGDLDDLETVEDDLNIDDLDDLDAVLEDIENI